MLQPLPHEKICRKQNVLFIRGSTFKLSTFRHPGPKQTLRQTGHSHQSLWILAMDGQPRFILEKRFDDFNQLHADLKEIEPGMCAAAGRFIGELCFRKWRIVVSIQDGSLLNRSWW